MLSGTINSNEFERAVVNAFDFLESERGFPPPALALDSATYEIVNVALIRVSWRRGNYPLIEICIPPGVESATVKLSGLILELGIRTSRPWYSLLLRRPIVDDKECLEYFREFAVLLRDNFDKIVRRAGSSSVFYSVSSFFVTVLLGGLVAALNPRYLFHCVGALLAFALFFLPPTLRKRISYRRQRATLVELAGRGRLAEGCIVHAFVDDDDRTFIEYVFGPEENEGKQEVDESYRFGAIGKKVRIRYLARDPRVSALEKEFEASRQFNGLGV